MYCLFFLCGGIIYLCPLDFPAVQGDGFDLTNVYTQPPVDARAIEANEDAQIHRSPSGTCKGKCFLSSAFKWNPNRDAAKVPDCKFVQKSGTLTQCVTICAHAIVRYFDGHVQNLLSSVLLFFLHQCRHHTECKKMLQPTCCCV